MSDQYLEKLRNCLNDLRKVDSDIDHLKWREFNQRERYIFVCNANAVLTRKQIDLD